jgi:hypothetical protein
MSLRMKRKRVFRMAWKLLASSYPGTDTLVGVSPYHLTLKLDSEPLSKLPVRVIPLF